MSPRRIALLVVAPLLALAVAPAQVAAAAPRPAHLHHYVRDWTGHTRSLHVRRDHTARESIYDGCCTQVVTLVLVLDDVRGTTAKGSVRACVTRVRFADPTYFDADHPVPAVGDTTRLQLRDGVLHEPLTDTIYCDQTVEVPGGGCGA